MEYSIPLFRLNFDEEEVQAVSETIRSAWISTGPRCAELESTFASMLGVRHAVSLSSCTAALHLSALLCGLGPGDEVLCPSLTFAATVNAIRYVGALPVFCDIVGPEHLNLDPDQLRQRITDRTRAIVVVHMAGFPARMDEILTIAREHDLRLIEDACHAPLSEYRGRKLGTLGDCATFSFFSNKNISTGEGGMLVTNDGAMADRARLLRSHGMTTMSYQRASGHATTYDVLELGYNYRLDDMRAAIACVQLRKLEADLRQRAQVRRWYLDRLLRVEGLHIPFADCAEFSSSYIMPVVLRSSTAARRDAVRDALHARGIQTSVHYPAIHRFAIYRGYARPLPMSEYVADNEITLPMYAALTEEQVAHVCDALAQALDQCP